MSGKPPTFTRRFKKNIGSEKTHLKLAEFSREGETNFDLNFGRPECRSYFVLARFLSSPSRHMALTRRLAGWEAQERGLNHYYFRPGRLSVYRRVMERGRSSPHQIDVSNRGGGIGGTRLVILNTTLSETTTQTLIDTRPPNGQLWRPRVVVSGGSENVRLRYCWPRRPAWDDEAELGLRGGLQVVWRGVCEFDFEEEREKGRILTRTFAKINQRVSDDERLLKRVYYSVIIAEQEECVMSRTGQNVKLKFLEMVVVVVVDMMVMVLEVVVLVMVLLVMVKRDDGDDCDGDECGGIGSGGGGGGSEGGD
ncbi:hypothetical protein E2C01_026080 [Portunus trituberculatus]|uniref:Uncharacterized protein n=1 Tax=Portunus trituberculatus TaxID=210409 RepID=A0A5B7EF44_PORTR|nr:hypothetical protein [Portunus trituberculatus]